MTPEDLRPEAMGARVDAEPEYEDEEEVAGAQMPARIAGSNRINGTPDKPAENGNRVAEAIGVAGAERVAPRPGELRLRGLHRGGSGGEGEGGRRMSPWVGSVGVRARVRVLLCPLFSGLCPVVRVTKVQQAIVTSLTIRSPCSL